MKKQARTFPAIEASGVYRLPASVSRKDLEQRLAGRRFGFFRIDGSHIQTKEQFLRRAASAMLFPEYFGHNWDAFQDCITDMSWHAAEGFVILYADPGPFLDSAPDDFNVAMEIFRDACDYWRGKHKSLFVLLQGPSTQEPHLGFLPI